MTDVVGDAMAMFSSKTLLGSSRNSAVCEYSPAKVKVTRKLAQGASCSIFLVELQNEELGIPNASYIMKRLTDGTPQETKGQGSTLLDLVYEGEILSRLQHKNVIALAGLSREGATRDASSDGESGHFLILEPLESTLQSRLTELRNDKQETGKRLGRQRIKASAADGSTLAIALGIAEGLNYLHEKGVLLRDLKPSNVGFDKDNVVKLFDFGFAREQHMVEEDEVKGSLRYLAPEVGMGYAKASFSSDVYSFGVLLYELCTLEKPFQNYASSRRALFEHVMVGGWRPSLSTVQRGPLRRLIKDCWSSNPRRRPGMDQVADILRKQQQRASTRHSPFPFSWVRSVHTPSQPSTGKRDKQLKKCLSSTMASDSERTADFGEPPLSKCIRTIRTKK